MLQNPEDMAKDSEVEVCSKEEGFVGAWYRAILEESPTISKRKKLRIRYTTLLQEDCSTPLTETVQQSFIRPVPPEDLYNGVVFVEGSVVDADLKDGWWHGVIAKELEDDQFLVYFDTPPDIMQFNRKQLRPHLDWTGSEWLRPDNKEMSKSLFSSGTMVEVSCEIAAWIPAIIIKEVEVSDENKVIVKSCNKSDEVNQNFTVDLCNVRPTPPPSFVEEYNLLERVDAFRGSAWRRSLVREVLSEDRYTVSLVATKEEYVFKHSDLRPSLEWEDGVWRQRPQRRVENETPLDGKRKKLVSEVNVLSRVKKLKVVRSCASAIKTMSSAGGNESITSTRKHVRKSAVHAEPNVGETVAVMESPLSQESRNHMADDGVLNDAATPVITTQVIPIESLMAADTSDNDDYDQPLSAWILGEKSSNDHGHSKLLSPDAAHEEDTRMVLPFVKRSSFWETRESMQVSAKQNPHFYPLLDTRRELREGLAVAEMVNFFNLLEEVRNLQLHTPKSRLEGLKECFYEREKYGFDVTEPVSRINMLVSLIDETVSREDKLKEIEKGKAEAVSKVQKVREDLRDVEGKILELHHEKSALKVKEDAAEKKIAQMQLCAEDLEQKLQAAELEFQKIVSAAW